VLAVFSLGLALALSSVFGNYIVRQARALVGALSDAPAGAPAHGPLRIQEFLALLSGVTAAKQREREATDHMKVARVERDETFDLYERAPCGYHSLDPEGRFVRMNETALRWLGYRWEELQGRPFTELLTAEGRVTFAANFPEFLRAGRVDNLEMLLVRKDGSTFPVSISATAIVDAQGRLVHSRSTSFDITERKRLEAQLDQMARTDPLTGLSNRRDFHERAGRELLRSRRNKMPLAVFMLDIDHFKRINDEHGHEGGDLVLQALAKACLPLLRNVDLLARIGGEEFAVMLPETAAGRAWEVAERLRQAIAALVIRLPSGQSVTFTVSIGIGHCEVADASIDAALKRADLALYQAKTGGRNQVRVAEDSGAG
jgi:diguanylate cyclase (GGDEF)-like protein/PAS domain S-box-containing protein